MPSLECPFCGRNLKSPSEPGVVTCDGCEQQFDPGKIRVQPASIGKEAIGWVMLVFGIVLLVPVVIAIVRSNFHDRAWPLRLFGLLLIPGALICTGLALKGGKTVVDGSLNESLK